MLPALFSANASASYFMEKREPIKRLAQPLTTTGPDLIALYPCTLLFSFSFFFFFWLHHTAYGILAHQPGIEPVLLAMEVQSLNHWTAKEVLCFQI